MKSFPIIGIGASAGGLDAIKGLIETCPPESNVAFIIIQHLSPDHESIMDSLLKKVTSISVEHAKDGTVVTPNHIYLNPPDMEMSLLNGSIILTKPDSKHAARMPIDFFFRSLAEDQREQAISIVLSGSGTDGTLGVKAIKEHGGLTIAQSLEQAKFDSMPRSAIGTGMVDLILPVEQMATELLKYANQPYIIASKSTDSKPKLNDAVMKKILLTVRSRTGKDFSNYKTNTISRRIERRMAVHRIEREADYLRFIEEDNREVEALVSDLLIGVTRFFRDTEAFEILREKALLPLIKDKPPETTLRIWVPGCSTGEEVYSLAMVALECVEQLGRSIDIQLFGTDIDDDSIDFARKGVYPDNIAVDVTPERLKRFFVHDEGSYSIKKMVRERIVFSTQNIIKDPPFSNLDLVSCRNLLIYMNQVLQKRILPMFHYTLVDRGILFLGTSETIGEFSSLFTAVDIKSKIFRKKGSPGKLVYPGLAIAGSKNYSTEKHIPKPLHQTTVRQFAEEVILSDYSPPCVMVDEKMQIVYFHGRTEDYIEPPRGEPSFDIMKMARPEIRSRMGAVLHKAIKYNTTSVLEGLTIKRKNEVISFNLTVRPLIEQNNKEKMVLVIFEPHETKVEIAGSKEPTQVDSEDPRIQILEQELQSTREYLQTTIEELETSNEELRSTNEELQSTNEELQSTNEELETSREEMQSTNEELETVNAELNSKVIELSKASDDLTNLLNATELATIFLDSNLCIKRFTPQSRDMFNLIKSDIGRPISDITTNLSYDAISSDSARVLENLQLSEREVLGNDGRTYQMRILPSRASESIVDGVVVTFFDVTAIKDVGKFYGEVVDTVREPLLVLDSGLKVILANQSFYKAFNTNEKNTINHRLFELGDNQWDIPELRKMLDKLLSGGREFNDFEVSHDFQSIGKKRMLLNARSLCKPGTKEQLILLAIEDVTGKVL